MAESKEGVDDMIVHLMSMGFEIQECQDAINFGKNTVETAVEWLISGKPGFNPATAGGAGGGTSLKLRPAGSEFETSTTPYQKPLPIPQGASASSSSSTSQSQTNAEKPTDQSESASAEMDQSEAPVVSRLHMNDTQRKQKDGFEQKKRDEARKQAMLEKRRQKEEHARVLKEIAEDRESKKLFKPSAAAAAGEVKSPPPPAESPSKAKAEEKMDVDVKQSSATCLLQIRLPDGKCLRQSFSASAQLQEVWDFTKGHHRDMRGFTFIQPFPRHEYSSAEMCQTLLELKLTPSGSLVLQKKQISQAVDEATEASEMVVEESPSSTAPASAVREPDASHIWGRGNPMGEEQGIDIPGAGGMLDQNLDDVNLPSDDDEEEEGEPEMVMPGFGHGIPGMPGMPGMGRGGHGMHMPAMGRGMDPFAGMGGQGRGHHHQSAFGGVGQRLVAPGDPGQEDLALQQRARPHRDLAFERAQARLAQPADNQDPHPAAPSPSSSSTHQPHSPSGGVISLLLHCLRHVTHRLNDPRHQILSLAGVPEDMAQVILQHLIKEKLLKPGTLKAFVPCYLRKLVLDCYPYTTNELLHAIRIHTNLSSLSLSSCPLITDAGLLSLNSLKKLRKLNLSCCKQISNKSAEAFTNMPNLVSLNLEDTGVTDTGVIQYLSSQPAHLQHLNLNRTSVTQAVIPHLCNCAKELRTLAVEDTKVVSLSGIQDIQHLESLNVARTGIVTESLLCIASCPRLKSLNVANTENLNGDEALRHIQNLQLHNLNLPSRHTTTNKGIQCLTGFPLLALDLTNYIFVTDEAMEHIGKIHSLKKLLLSNTKLTDAGMVFLEGLKQLEELNIDRTLVTDEGASIIRGLTNLVELSMASTGVTTKFLLSGTLNACTNLIKLNLSKTLVTSKGVKSLSLPFLQLLSLDGTKVTPDLTVAMVTSCPSLAQMPARNLQVFTRDDEVEEAEMSGS